MINLQLKIILFFLLSINLFGSDFKIEKSLDSIYPKAYFDYDNFPTSILMLQPDKLYDKCTINEKMFVDIFYKIRNNNIDEGAYLLENSLTNYDGITKNLAADYLFDYYLLNDNYSKIEALRPNSELKKNDTTLKKTEIINFVNDTLNVSIKSNVIIIAVTIGENLYNFLFDTGTNKSIIKNSVFKDNNLTKFEHFEPIKINSVENSNSFLTEIPILKLGRNQIKNSDFIVVNDEDLELNTGFFRKSLVLDGIIGWDIIRNFEFEFQINENLIIINPIDKVQNKFPFNNLFYLGHPFLQLQVSNGYVLNFFFDSGSFESNITDLLTQKLMLEFVDEKTTEISSIGGNKEYVTKKYKNLELCFFDYKLKFDFISTHFENNIRFAYYDGIIGADVLMNNKIYFSPKRGIFSFIN
jgi:hypothetical protein